ncbi:hypothetical protein [Glycomyces paridis]|uniref:hypothetical protein n=1 Tax=Glycomyces paridis TaxID=2126555 RepID=UPI00186496B4|nr:hypothetical protein [Glycomyces paridis]
MWKILGILILVWLAFSVLGFVIKGLLWLAVIGIILFLATAVYGIFKERSDRS